MAIITKPQRPLILRNAESRAYWLAQLKAPVKCAPPYDYFSPHPEPGWEMVDLPLSPELSRQLILRADGDDWALYMILSAGMVFWLFRLTGQLDIITGSPVRIPSGEKEGETRVVPVRSRLLSQMTFRALVRQFRETYEEAVKHADFPLDILPQYLGLPDYGAPCGLYETAARLTDIHEPETPDHMIYSLCFQFHRNGGGLSGLLYYHRHRYARRTAEQMAWTYAGVLEQGAQNMELKLADALPIRDIHPLTSSPAVLSALAPSPPETPEHEKNSCTHIDDYFVPAEDREYYSLSPAQERHFYLHYCRDYTGVTGNMPQILPLSVEINRERAERTFQLLIRRHEMLRSSFPMVNGRPVLKIHAHAGFELVYFQSADWRDEGSAGAYAAALRHFSRPFDLTEPPLFRAALMRNGDRRGLLLAEFHPIIADEKSVEIIVREFISLYMGGALAAVPARYRDFLFNLHNPNGQLKQTEREKYWLDVFRDGAPDLTFPYNYERPLMRNFQGDYLERWLTPELTDRIRSIAKDRNYSLYAVFLAVYYLLLAGLGRTKRVTVGAAVDGRHHPMLLSVVGVFADIVPLLMDVDVEKPFHIFLREVEKNTADAMENADYPFDELIRKLNLADTVERHPLYRALYIYRKRERRSGFNHEVEGVPEPETANYNYQVSSYELTLTVIDEGDRLGVHFQYASELFKKETIRLFIGYYTALLDCMAEDVEQIPGCAGETTFSSIHPAASTGKRIRR